MFRLANFEQKGFPKAVELPQKESLNSKLTSLNCKSTWKCLHCCKINIWEDMKQVHEYKRGQRGKKRDPRFSVHFSDFWHLFLQG